MPKNIYHYFLKLEKTVLYCEHICCINYSNSIFLYYAMKSVANNERYLIRNGKFIDQL